MNRLWASKKVLEMSDIQNETGPRPPVGCCASGIQGLQLPLKGSLDLTCCVACESIFDAGSGGTE